MKDTRLYLTRRQNGIYYYGNRTHRTQQCYSNGDLQPRIARPVERINWKDIFVMSISECAVLPTNLANNGIYILKFLGSEAQF